MIIIGIIRMFVRALESISYAFFDDPLDMSAQ